LAILAACAVLIGACVYWSPYKLWTAPKQGSAAVVESRDTNPLEADVPADQDTAGSNSTIPVVRKSAASPDGTRTREPVLVATPAVPTSPLAALPEKVIAGFPPRPQKTLSSDPLASLVKHAKHLRAEGQLVEARDLLSDAYLAHRLTREQRKRLAVELEPIAWEILRSHTILPDGQLYEVESGDVLIKIARPLHVSPEFLMRINGLKNARLIRQGQRLKLVNGPFDLLAEPAEFELTVLHHGKFVRRFTIGVGRSDSPTPVGLFTVGTKLINPTYYPPPSDTEHRRPLPPGHPENPLGTRWIDIGLGYGIHGTADAQSVGQESSRGCIRMRNDDVEELYDIVTEGSRVLIR
jgi:LysM repeat protein